METPNDAQAVHKWVEDRRVTQFLKGLNPEFESRRDAFCHQDTLPTLEDAISTMVQEEIKLRVMGGNNLIKSAYTIADDKDCYNCGDKGHLSYNFPQPRNYNGVRFGICGGRGGSRVGYGGGCGACGGGRGRG